MFKTLFIFFFFFENTTVMASITPNIVTKKINYRTSFGQCPSKVAGQLTLNLIKNFEQHRSLKKLKEYIVSENLAEKHFLSDYKVSFSPVEKKLYFKYECPRALLKVQIYKENGDEFYTAVLTDNAKLVDPTYEVLLRSEGKLSHPLANLAMPVEMVDKKKHHDLVLLVSEMGPSIFNHLSEIILNPNAELTMILSISNQAASVFMGREYWSEKVEKLGKIIGYMQEKKTIPAIINLTNLKKIVVKFSDNI